MVQVRWWCVPVSFIWFITTNLQRREYIYYWSCRCIVFFVNRERCVITTQMIDEIVDRTSTRTQAIVIFKLYVSCA